MKKVTDWIFDKTLPLYGLGLAIIGLSIYTILVFFGVGFVGEQKHVDVMNRDPRLYQTKDSIFITTIQNIRREVDSSFEVLEACDSKKSGLKTCDTLRDNLIAALENKMRVIDSMTNAEYRCHQCPR